MISRTAVLVPAAVMLPAGMLLPVVTAVHIRVEVQCSRQKCCNGLIGIPRNSSVKCDSGICQRHLRSAADSSAD